MGTFGFLILIYIHLLVAPNFLQLCDKPSLGGLSDIPSVKVFSPCGPHDQSRGAPCLGTRLQYPELKLLCSSWWLQDGDQWDNARVFSPWLH